MDDFNSIRFSAEIFEAVVNNGDGRKKGQKIKNSEILEIIQKLFDQNCVGLIPDEECHHLSYIQPNFEEMENISSISDLLSNAIEELIPVQLDAGNGYVPYVYNFLLTPEYKFSRSRGWKNLPAYDPIPELFPIKEGFKPWFAVFSDSWGNFLFFYYPENPEGIIEIPYSGINLGGYKVYWRHGTPGLSQILQIIYFEWLARNYSYGLIET